MAARHGVRQTAGEVRGRRVHCEANGPYGALYLVPQLPPLPVFWGGEASGESSVHPWPACPLRFVKASRW